MKKKGVPWILIMVILFSYSISGCISDHNPNNTSEACIVDLNNPSAYHSIQEAINACPENGTVYLQDGTYVEKILVNKTIHIHGNTAENTIIDGNFSGNGMEITADEVTLSNITVQHAQDAASSSKYASGILIKGNNIKVHHCILRNNTAGIQITTEKYNHIVHTIFYNNSYGIYAASTSYNTIENNTFLASTNYGIYLYSISQYNNISKNVFRYNTNSIRIKGNNNLVFYNEFIENEGGLYFCCSATGNVVYQNNFINNSMYDGKGNYRDNTWYHAINETGNYWDSYSGEDANQDGIGDTFYRIAERNHSGTVETIEDHYPLMQPFPISKSNLG